MLEPARLEFAADGTPLSSTDGAPSPHRGPEQSRHAFLGGNGLPERWQAQDRFVILETGFGLGLNFLVTWQAWRNDPQRCRRLHFVAFEPHPFTQDDLATAQRTWPEFAELAAQLQRHWPPLTPGLHRLSLDDHRVILTLVFGEASTQLRAIAASVDAFYLDNFCPSRLPESWTPTLCLSLTRLAAPGATLTTNSAAEPLREALADAQFELQKRPSFDGKQPMLVGCFRSRRPHHHAPPAERRALVIGAGIAGSTAAWALAAAGWQVTVLESQAGVATGASGNLAGVLRPLPSADDNRLSRLTRAGYLATRRLLADLPDARWAACGVLHLGRDAAHEAQQRRAVERLGLPEEILRFVDAEAASTLIGRPVTTGGWWFPEGGWVQPPSLCAAALAAFPERISVRFNTPVAGLQPSLDGWQAVNAEGNLLAEAPVAIVAGGVAGPHIAQLAFLPQRAARGQVSHLPADAVPPLAVVVCKQGYTAPAVDGLQLCGATLQSGDTGSELRLADHIENLERLARSLPGFADGIDPTCLDGKVGFRPMSPDRLPIVGAVPDASKVPANARLPMLPRHPGLWCVQGFGARGIVWSALMADLLVSRIEGEPLPLENDLVDAVDPGRFLLNKNTRAMAEDSDDST